MSHSSHTSHRQNAALSADEQGGATTGRRDGDALCREAPVVLDIDRTLITLEDAELHSPGLSKPMQRRYEYIQTPECLRHGAEGVPVELLNVNSRSQR